MNNYIYIYNKYIYIYSCMSYRYVYYYIFINIWFIHWFCGTATLGRPHFSPSKMGETSPARCLCQGFTAGTDEARAHSLAAALPQKRLILSRPSIIINHHPSSPPSSSSSSITIHQYPSVSITIHQYPSIIRHYPSISIRFPSLSIHFRF